MCANCHRDALYTYEVSAGYLINYCQYHLPKFLTSKKNAGLLTLQVPAPVVVEEPVVKPSKKKAEVVEEPVVEVPVEEPSEDDATN